MSTLALCLIARNEEQMLPACLMSVAGVVDELIVVDTGSTDRTRELAREAGARVIDFSWCDDFAAARNVAVRAATADWVLQLDADERLAPGGGPPIRALIQQPGVTGALMPLFESTRLDASPSQVLSGESSGEPQLLARLFRRTPDLVWRGRVHEQPDAWLRLHRSGMAVLAVPILHYGAVPDWRALRGKAERNIRLLELQIAESSRLCDFAYLSTELQRLGRLDAAREAQQAGWRTLQADLDSGRDPGAFSTLVLGGERAQHQMYRGDLRGAAETLDVVEALTGSHPNLEFLRGQLTDIAVPRSGPQRAAKLQQAGLHYQAASRYASRVFSTPVLLGASSWRAHSRLAGVLLRLGDYASALEEANKVRPSSPAGEGTHGPPWTP